MTEKSATPADTPPLHTQSTPLFDYRSLAAFRIAFGITLFANLYLRTASGKLDAFYTDAGILPLSLLKRGNRWSFLDSFSSPESIRWALAGICIVYAAYTAGFLTKYAKWAVVFILLSLYHRNPLIDDGSDWVMRLFALWTALLPLGRSLSLDSRFYPESRLRREADCRLAAFGFTLNLSASYFLNAFQKTGPSWYTGDALRTVLWDPWVISPVGVLLRNSSLCNYLPIASFGALALEYLLSALILCCFFSVWARRGVCTVMFLLHGGFAVCMFLGTFVPMYFSLALLFIPGADWDRWSIRLNSHAHARAASITTELSGLLMILWCGTLVIIGNPLFSGSSLRTRISSLIPTVVERWSQHAVMTQEWFMFGSPPAKVDTVVVSALRSDGHRVDPFRAESEVAEIPFYQSAHMGKYWVSYFFRLQLEGYAEYRERFTEYLFSLGYRDVKFMSGTMQVPESCEAPQEGPVFREVFSALRPIVFKPRVSDVVRDQTKVRGVGEQAMDRFGSQWREGWQLHADLAPDDGRITISFSSELACLAEARLLLTHAPDYGQIDVLVNNGSTHPIDLFSALGVVRQEHTLGMTQVGVGKNTVAFVLRSGMTGRTKIGIDEIRFICQ